MKYVTLGTLGTLVGLDKHLLEQSSCENSELSMLDNSDCGTSTIEKSEEHLDEGIHAYQKVRKFSYLLMAS